MGAKPYPMLPQMGLMHGALGNEIVEFLQGNETAEQALKDVEAAYNTKAKEQGFLSVSYTHLTLMQKLLLEPWHTQHHQKKWLQKLLIKLFG